MEFPAVLGPFLNSIPQACRVYERNSDLHRLEEDEELRVVRIWSSICHRQQASFGVQLHELLIFEGLAIDGQTACPIS